MARTVAAKKATARKTPPPTAQKVVAAKPKVKTISVGGPAPPKTITVLGIEFETGDSMKFGKARYKSDGRLYYFMKIENSYIMWRDPGKNGTFNDAFGETVTGFDRYYEAVDWDTPMTDRNGMAVAPDDMGYDDEPLYDDDDY